MKTEYWMLKNIQGYNDAQLAEWALFAALDEKLENEPWDLTEPYDPQPPLTWPSTITALDRVTGGCYGMTVISAQKGTGKTMLARSSAIEAAASGEWQVVLFLAEDDYDGWRDGFNIYLTQYPEMQACLPYLHVEQVGRNQTPATLAMSALHRIDLLLDRPVLIAIDSINSVVNLSNSNYLQRLGEWGIWCMLARRLSRGRVSFMLTSEANRAGNAKGEGLPYWADLHLKMGKRSDMVVEMDLDKTRRTGGEGPLGKHRRAVARGRFLTEEELYDGRPLRAVGGTDWAAQEEGEF